MDKKTFCKILKTIERGYVFENKLYEVCREYNDNSRCDVTIEGLGLGLEDEVIDLLAEIMDDNAGDIAYFVYEINFGREYQHGMVHDIDGKDVDFSTAEKLYDYLEAKKNGQS